MSKVALARNLINKKHYFSLNCRNVSTYSWGTSIKGSIPISTSNVGGVTSTTPTTATDTKKMFDHPQKILNLNNVVDNKDKVEENNSQITKYKCGVNNSAIILDNGACYTWGDNESGQLGHGQAQKTILSPTKLPPCDLTEIGVKDMLLGYTFSAAIDLYGDLHTFGFGGNMNSGFGFLGHGNGDSYYTPKRVDSLIEDGVTVQDAHVGDSHMTVLTTEGEVLTTGAGSYGRLGNLESVDQLYLEPVEMLANMNVISIAGGHSFTLALTDEGIIYAWGRNDKGQLGCGGGLLVDMYAMESIPQPIMGQLEGRTVTQISAGHGHSACATDDGELYIWGMKSFLEPQSFTKFLKTKKCGSLSCGHDYTMILSEDRMSLFSFGKNKTGVLGQAHTKSLHSPELVEGMSGCKILDMSAGDSHFACLVEDNVDDVSINNDDSVEKVV